MHVTFSGFRNTLRRAHDWLSNESMREEPSNVHFERSKQKKQTAVSDRTKERLTLKSVSHTICTPDAMTENGFIISGAF